MSASFVMQNFDAEDFVKELFRGTYDGHITETIRTFLPAELDQVKETLLRYGWKSGAMRVL